MEYIKEFALDLKKEIIRIRWEFVCVVIFIFAAFFVEGLFSGLRERAELDAIKEFQYQFELAGEFFDLFPGCSIVEEDKMASLLSPNVVLKCILVPEFWERFDVTREDITKLQTRIWELRAKYGYVHLIDSRHKE